MTTELIEALELCEEHGRNETSILLTEHLLAVCAALREADNENQKLREALRQIQKSTDADDDESYRADDREGCLDYVHWKAKNTLEATK